MKFQTNIKIDLNQDDFLEKTAQDALKAYAKNVARSTVEAQIHKEIEEITERHLSDLKNKSYYLNTPLERMVQNEIDKIIRQDLHNSSDIRNKIDTQARKLLLEQQATITAYVKGRTIALFKEISIEDYIKSEIKAVITDAVQSMLSSYLQEPRNEC